MARFNVFAGEANVTTRKKRAKTDSHYRWRPVAGAPLYERHEATEDVERVSGGGLSARIFVGLNVGQTQKYTEQDIVEKVVAIRRKQQAAPDMSILSQRGIYTDRDNNIVDEPSVQIIIIDLAGMGKREFTEQMAQLAEALLEQLEQETIILEIQLRGIVKDVFVIT